MNCPCSSRILTRVFPILSHFHASRSLSSSSRQSLLISYHFDRCSAFYQFCVKSYQLYPFAIRSRFSIFFDFLSVENVAIDVNV